MKVTQIETKDHDKFCLSINGEERIRLRTPEPEDCSFGRDLNFVLYISELMKEAYEAGKNGEPFEIEKIIEIDLDDF